MSSNAAGRVRATPLFAVPPSGDGDRVQLFPLVNLFLSLIPFLLLCVGFAPLAAAQLDLPTQPAPPATRGEAKVVLNLLIRPALFQIEAQSSTLNAQQLRHLSSRLPRVIDAPDAADRSYAQLSQALYQIKQHYPASDTVVLIPDDTIPYEDVIATMDIIRERTVARGASRSRETLFPVVILGSTRPGTERR